MKTMNISLGDLAESFGTTADDFDDLFVGLYNSSDWSYKKIEGQDRDALILDILRFISTDSQVIGETSRTEEWDRGWKENLDAFLANKDVAALNPKFLRPNQPVRWKQEFIMPTNNTFEKDFVSLFQQWFFSKYFSGFENIYEFGCGSGFNLMPLAKMRPDAKLVGTDFALSAVRLINELSRHFNLKLEGYFFDMIKPDFSFDIRPNSCLFTSGSIEQLASQFHPFLNFILRKNPALCCHIEPTVELYDENNVIDYLGILFFRKRGYSAGLLPYLKYLHEQGVVELIKFKRLYFGSVRMEGWNYIIWRPL